MASATITSKGQITIPVEIRNMLSLKKGDKVNFHVNKNGCVEMIPKTMSVKDLEGALPRPRRAASIEEMNEAVANIKRI